MGGQPKPRAEPGGAVGTRALGHQIGEHSLLLSPPRALCSECWEEAVIN